MSFLKNFSKFTWKHPCRSLFFKKIACIQARCLLEIPTQVFSCEFCDVLRTVFLTENLHETEKYLKSFTLLLFVTYEFSSSKSTKHFVIKQKKLISWKTSTSNEICFHCKRIQSARLVYDCSLWKSHKKISVSGNTASILIILAVSKSTIPYLGLTLGFHSKIVL